MWSVLKRGVWVAVILTCGCSDPIRDEEKRLEMVKGSGSAEDVCHQSKAVAAAALKAKDPRYAELNTAADINCMTAQQNPGESWDQATNTSATPIMADNMEAGVVN